MELLSSEHWTLLADAIIAVLLLATIAYAAILERKLSALRASKQEMAELVDRFTEAMRRAEGGLVEIKQTAEQTGRTLLQAVDKGNSLADDLVFLVERGDAVAGRLERGAAKGRGRAEPPSAGAGASGQTAAKPPAQPAATEEAATGRERTPEQTALMAALRAMR